MPENSCLPGRPNIWRGELGSFCDKICKFCYSLNHFFPNFYRKVNVSFQAASVPKPTDGFETAVQEKKIKRLDIL